VLYTSSQSFLIYNWQNDMHATDIIALKTDDVYDNNNIINDK